MPQETDPGATAAPPAAAPPVGYGRAWYAVVILVLLYCMSFTDRMVLSLLAAPVSQALGVSDTQLGMLFGLGFGAVYALAGLPLAHLVDRHNRVRLICFGVMLWSACTVASGFSPNYTALMVLRAGVAVGEAILSPAAISLIADLFPRGKRTLPTSVYSSVGSFMGSGAFVVGGLALDLAVMTSHQTSLPPWQLTLVFVGLPGLLLGPLLLFTVPEAPRVNEVQAEDLVSVKGALSFANREKSLYGFLFIGVALYTICTFAKAAWLPTLMVRGYGLRPAEAGYWYGAFGLIAGVAGSFLWPLLASWLTRRGHKDALIGVYAVGVFVALAFLTIAGLTRSLPVVLGCVLVNTFFGSTAAVLPPLILQYVAPGRMRGRLMAVNLMASNLVGLSIGPALAAFISDRFFDGPFALASGIAVLGIVMTPLAALSIWLARPRYRLALDEAARREGVAA